MPAFLIHAVLKRAFNNKQIEGQGDQELQIYRKQVHVSGIFFLEYWIQFNSLAPSGISRTVASGIYNLEVIRAGHLQLNKEKKIGVLFVYLPIPPQNKRGRPTTTVEPPLILIHQILTVYYQQDLTIILHQ